MSCFPKRRVPDLDMRWGRPFPEEARAAARLFLISAGGAALRVWSHRAVDGQTPEDAGAALYLKEASSFSYEDCLFAVRKGRPVGLIHATHGGGPLLEAVPGSLLQELAGLFDPGALFMSAFAVDPAHRQQGIGSEMLDCAHALAMARAKPRVSLICFESNRIALDFFTTRGYRELLRRAIASQPDFTQRTGDALLLSRDL